LAEQYPLGPPVHKDKMMKELTPKEITEIEAKLGHSFHKDALLCAALSHPSLGLAKNQKAGSASAYERLEFLGDRVLGLVVAEWLYEKYPTSTEGDLSKRLSALVNKDCLNAVAEQMGLQNYVQVARNDKIEDTRKNLSLYADAFEALVGALYQDAGLDKVRAFLRRVITEDMAATSLAPEPKTALQEWAQKRKLPLPEYKIKDQSGPAHAPSFVVEVMVAGYAPVAASGISKREAEKSAAKLFLEQLETTHVKK
jgi:ribonuclease III